MIFNLIYKFTLLLNIFNLKKWKSYWKFYHYFKSIYFCIVFWSRNSFANFEYTHKILIYFRL